jgi:hypothetical protein
METGCGNALPAEEQAQRRQQTAKTAPQLTALILTASEFRAPSPIAAFLDGAPPPISSSLSPLPLPSDS